MQVFLSDKMDLFTWVNIVLVIEDCKTELQIYIFFSVWIYTGYKSVIKIIEAA